MDYSQIMHIYLAITLITAFVFAFFSTPKRILSKYTNIWFFGFALKSAGLALVIANEYFEWRTFDFIATLFSIAANLIILHGIALAFKRKIPVFVYWVNGVTIVLLSFFYFIIPNPDICLIITSLLFSFTFIMWFIKSRFNDKSYVSVKYIRTLQVNLCLLILVQLYFTLISILDLAPPTFNFQIYFNIGLGIISVLSGLLLVSLMILRRGVIRFSVGNTILEEDKEQILQDSERNYKKLIKALPMGMATHRLIYDKKVEPLIMNFYR